MPLAFHLHALRLWFCKWLERAAVALCILLFDFLGLLGHRRRGGRD